MIDCCLQFCCRSFAARGDDMLVGDMARQLKQLLEVCLEAGAVPLLTKGANRVHPELDGVSGAARPSVWGLGQTLHKECGTAASSQRFWSMLGTPVPPGAPGTDPTRKCTMNQTRKAFAMSGRV